MERSSATVETVDQVIHMVAPPQKTDLLRLLGGAARDGAIFTAPGAAPTSWPACCAAFGTRRCMAT